MPFNPSVTSEFNIRPCMKVFSAARPARPRNCVIRNRPDFLSFLTFPTRVLLRLPPQFDLLEPTPRQIYKVISYSKIVIRFLVNYPSFRCPTFLARIFSLQKDLWNVFEEQLSHSPHATFFGSVLHTAPHLC